MIKFSNKMKILKFICVVFLAGFFAVALTGCNANSHFVKVKYRDDAVNISDPRWDKLINKESTFVDGAWYDVANEYMIINLNGTYYHYCGLPTSIWAQFNNASSYGSYYNQNIKGNYDCRIYRVPSY